MLGSSEISSKIFSSSHRPIPKSSKHNGPSIIQISLLTKDGTVEKFVNLANLIPIPVSDLESKLTIRPKSNKFLDLDQVFKLNHQEEYFLFEKDGLWNQENVALPEFDVQVLFSEDQWFNENNEMR